MLTNALNINRPERLIGFVGPYSSRYVWGLQRPSFDVGLQLAIFIYFRTVWIVFGEMALSLRLWIEQSVDRRFSQRRQESDATRLRGIVEASFADRLAGIISLMQRSNGCEIQEVRQSLGVLVSLAANAPVAIEGAVYKVEHPFA